MFLLAALWHRCCAGLSGCISFFHSVGFDQCFVTCSERVTNNMGTAGWATGVGGPLLKARSPFIFPGI